MRTFRSVGVLACALSLLIAGLFEAGLAIRSRSAEDSDLTRQWVTSQYVHQGKNPYPIALGALEARYGRLAPAGPAHLKTTRIFAIPKSGPHPETDAKWGPPEATYPPATALVLAGTIGLLDRGAALQVWLIINLLLTVLLARELAGRAGWNTALGFLLMFSATLAWPATAACLARDQFSLLAVWALLMALRFEGKRPEAAGLFYAAALLKPSLAFPFLLLPLVAQRWRVLGTVVAVQGGLLAASAVVLHAMPWVTIPQWVEVAAYFRQGIYTVQDFVNGAQLDGTLLDRALPLVLLAAAGLLLRRVDITAGVVLVSFLSAFWMYHGGYDFVVLLVAVPSLLESTGRTRILAALAVGIVGVGLIPGVYGADSAATRALRWTARFSLIAGLAVSPGLGLHSGQPGKPGLDLLPGLN